MKKALQDARWLRAAEAMQYFSIKRNQLYILAEAANAKKKIAKKCVLYDVVAIETYIRQL